MDNVTEIRWHARGGQGAKTASLLFAESMLSLGEYIQAFPEYGPERTGAPTKAYNRISDLPIRNYSAILEPDVVVILDPTLLKNEEVISGLGAKGVLIINTEKSSAEIGKSVKTNAKILAVPASKIAKDILGKNIPNTVMLGTLFKVLKIDLKDLGKSLKDRLTYQFKNKPDMIQKNLKAIEEAYNYE